jgi:hypothetical protein
MVEPKDKAEYLSTSCAGAGAARAISQDTIVGPDDAWSITGNVTVKVEPFAIALSALTDPPRNSVNCFTI